MLATTVPRCQSRTASACDEFDRFTMAGNMASDNEFRSVLVIGSTYVPIV
jgi:hypothetical protein